MHMLIYIYAHMYTHRSLDTIKYIQEKVSSKKNSHPLRRIKVKKRFTERTSRETEETPHCPRGYTFSKQLKRLQRSIQRSTIYQFFHNDCLCRTSLEHSSALHDKPASPRNNVPLTNYSLHNTISSGTTDVCFGIKERSCCLECSPLNEAL